MTAVGSTPRRKTAYAGAARLPLLGGMFLTLCPPAPGGRWIFCLTAAGTNQQLRVNQAGELAATLIYAAQTAAPRE